MHRFTPERPVCGRPLLAGRAATLIAGPRFSTWKSDHFYIYDSPDATFHNDYDKFMPYAGLIYDISRQLLGVRKLHGDLQAAEQPRHDRRAISIRSTARSYEVGMKGEHFDGRLNTALTLFETRQNNVAAPAIDPETGEPVDRCPMARNPRCPSTARARAVSNSRPAGVIDDIGTCFGWSRYQIEDADGNAIRTFTPER